MPVIQLDIDASGSVRGIKQYEQAARQGAAATDRLAGASAKAKSGFEGLEKKVLSVGAAYLTVSNAISQAVKAVDITTGYDDALRVASSYAGVLDETSREFTAMGEAAKAAGAATSKTTKDAAVALGEFTSKGFSAQQAITALTPAIRLAEAAQADLGRAAAVSSGIMRGFGKDVDYLERVNDVIVGISGASSLNLDRIGDAAKYAVPAANAAGESIESMMSVIGSLVDQQLEAGQAGNAYKYMILSLIQPSSEAATQLARMGVTTKDSQGNFLGLLPILDQFAQKGLSLGQAANIFNTRWATAALIATKSIKEIRKDTNYLTNDIDGLSTRAAEFQQAGLGGEFRKLGSAIEAVYIAVGEQMTPVLQTAAKMLTEYASNAKKTAEASIYIIQGSRFVTNAFLGVYASAGAANVGLSKVYAGLLKLNSKLNEASGWNALWKKATGQDLNAYSQDSIKNAERFADTQVEGFKDTIATIESANKKFDEWAESIKKGTAEKEKAAAADKAMQTAAEAAGVAAGKAAASQGKSFTEASAAAAAAKKSYLEQAEAAKKAQADSESSEKAKKSIAEKTAEIEKQALSYGFAAEKAREYAEEQVKNSIKIKEEAEKAGVAAGKAANAQGKSVEYAVKAAEAAKNLYIDQAQAAYKKQETETKSAASAATAKTALEEQAAAIKRQALSYNYTAEQAQAAADKVLATSKAADSVSSKGVDDLALALTGVEDNAQAAAAALVNASTPDQRQYSGIVSFTADLDLSPYEEKAEKLRSSVAALDAEISSKSNLTAPQFQGLVDQLSGLQAEYSKAQAELEKQQGIDSLNQKLKEVRSELSQTRQTFADGNLVIDTDPAATAALQGQVQALNDAKLAAGAMGAGFEYVNGVLTNLSPAAAAAKAAYDGLADSSGNIATEWRQIDGVWTEVLPNGEKLVDAVNKKMAEGVAAAGEFGGAVAAAAGQISSGIAEADKIIASLTGSVEKAAAKAGTLKFDELKNSTTALEVVRAQIKSLEGDIKTFGITSEQGQAAVAGILKLEAVESSAQAKIKALHDEIYGTGEEAKKTAAAVGEIPAAASSAAAAVEELSAANQQLASSADAAANAAASSVNSYTFTVDSSITGINNRIKDLNETIESLESITSYEVDTSKLREEIADLEAKKLRFSIESDSDSFFSKLSDKISRFKAGINIDFSAGTTRTTEAAQQTSVGTTGAAQSPATYNFYGYDRSDAADIVNRSNRAARRA